MQYRKNPQVFSQKNGQILYILGDIWTIFGLENVFLKNQTPSLFSILENLTSCKKSKKANDWNCETFCYWRTLPIPEDPKYAQKV